MRIVQVNTVPFGSTGKIMMQIASLARMHGHEVWVCYKRWRKSKNSNPLSFKIGSFLGNIFNRILTPVFSADGNGSNISTKRLIKFLDKIKPDVIHLHNLHGWYLNCGKLFKYIKKNNVRVVWTLHDCWAFTGHCPHFDFIHCEKWKSLCENCSQYKNYPKTLFDKSRKMFKKKKEWFTGVSDLTIVTPSNWLARLVEQSFLKDYHVEIINNGIDLEIFKPRYSDFRNKYNCINKKIILGVAFGWGIRKGLDVFIEINNRLSEDFQIVLVGTDEKVDKILPSNIISIHKTNNQIELAEIYTAADMFVNPTREDNFPTVNIESLACGTPVLTFNVGGSAEIIDEKSGTAIKVDDIDALCEKIYELCNNDVINESSCITRAKIFDKYNKLLNYVRLYEEK